MAEAKPEASAATVPRDAFPAPHARDDASARDALRYRALVRATATMTVNAAADGSFDAPQEAWSAYTGQSFDEQRGFGWLGAIHPEDRPAGQARFAEAILTRSWFEQRMRVWHAPSGEHRWCDIRAVPVIDESGTVEEWFGISVDVHARTLVEIERTRLERGLRETEARFRTLADTLPQLVWTARPDGAVDYFNNRWYAYTGATPAEHLGWGWEAAVEPSARPGVLQRYRHSLETGEIFEADVPLRGADRVYRWHLVRAQPVRDEEGRIARWVGTSTDIDERRRLAEELREANRQKNQFLAMLSHELRSPLAPIRNAAELLRTRRSDAETVDWARAVVDRQVRHLSRLVEDLLDVSRIVEGRIVLRREPIELAATVAAAVEIVRPKLDERAQELRCDLPLEPIGLDADPTRIAQVIANLLDNASKYSESGAAIDVEATAGDEEVAIRVRDRGIGIAPEQRSAIFDLFTQADPSLARSQGGLGIGLTLVRRLVELHGGNVAVESEGLGHGSTFTVRLPTSTRRAVPQRAAPPPASLARRVLVVDDSADAADSLALVLETAGHEVRVAYDGRAASEAALAFRPDVALVDIGLPGMDGYELGEWLRRELGESLRLIAITGYGRHEDRVRTRRAGFDGHLVKPLDLGELERWLVPADPDARP